MFYEVYESLLQKIHLSYKFHTYEVYMYFSWDFGPF
jgi:hypothetical protein